VARCKPVVKFHWLYFIQLQIALFPGFSRKLVTSCTH